MKVWLDDLRRAPDGWTRAYNARQVISMLMGGSVTHLSLDHDLGNPEIVGTGYDVIKWLEREAFRGKFYVEPENINVHSANVWGKSNMERGIRKIKQFYQEIGNE